MFISSCSSFSGCGLSCTYFFYSNVSEKAHCFGVFLHAICKFKNISNPLYYMQCVSFYELSYLEAWLQINKLSACRIALVIYNKWQGKRDHLEWKVMPPVKAGDNIPKQRVCIAIQRGCRLYFRQQQERCQREREREREYAYTQFTVHERDPRKLKSFLG